MSKTITPALRKKIIDQSLKEIEFERKKKRKRIAEWHINESLYYNDTKNLQDQRANIGIANTKAQGFVSTLLSKIDSPPNIKYMKGAEADLKPALRMNSLFAQDMDASRIEGNLNFKDILSKKSGIIRGRVIFEYHASSVKGYKSVVTNVSPYDFLIDSSAGGLDVENALYLGRTGIWKSKVQLRAGQKKKTYQSKAVTELLKHNGSQAEGSEEEKEKVKSKVTLNNEESRVLHRDDRFVFWEWYTTVDDQRYYVLLNEEHKLAPRVETIEKLFKSAMYPFWSWATDPDDERFWSLAPMDMMRNVFMAQGVTIDQMMDGAEAILRPMKGVVGDAVKNLSSLKYGRDKIVRFKSKTDLSSALKVFETPSLETPLVVYDKLEQIGNLESGVSADAKGTSDEDKVGIYEGNVQAIADRFGLLNKSYANGYQRFGLLYKQGVEEHLKTKTAIEIIGANGIEMEDVLKKDIKPSKPFRIVVEASDAEMQSDLIEKKTKLAFLATKAGNVAVNQQKLIEIEAGIAGFKKEDVDQLLDVQEFGDAELMSEAARDIERILGGEFDLKPNENATNPYKQKIVDYVRDQKEHMEEDVFAAFVVYIQSITPFVTENTLRKAREAAAKANQLEIDALLSGGGNIPTNVPTQTQSDSGNGRI